MQIKTNKISHTFNKGMLTEHLAISDVSTTINQGEFITIIGHTGSGKTTFIEHLNALLLPTTGEVIIGDKIITNTKRKIKNIKAIRKQVGVVFQFAEYQLFEETIEKDIIFGPISMGVPKDEAKELASKYIELVGLSEEFLEISPFSLSGGQKRRVALAGILAMEPDILIFDEPTAGLDPQGEKDMYEIFKNLHLEGKTIVIVTHNLDHVLEHSMRTLVFTKGELVKDDASIEIMYDVDFLLENELEPPKLVSLVYKLEANGIKVGMVNSIEELAAKLHSNGKMSKRLLRMKPKKKK